MQYGVVFDALHKDLFTARRGKGAQLNGKPIHVSKAKTLATSLLATGFAYDRRERRRFYLAFWEDMMTRVEGLRRAGSAALDLASVACGRLDGFWEFGLKPWDIAAGSLLVSEAGGTVTNMDGTPLDIAGAQILATNRRIHREMAQVLTRDSPRGGTSPPRDASQRRQSFGITPPQIVFRNLVTWQFSRRLVTVCGRLFRSYSVRTRSYGKEKWGSRQQSHRSRTRGRVGRRLTR